NLNIVAHSYGGIIAEQIGNSMRSKMAELDYSTQEIDSAMSQVSLLTMGSVGNIANTQNNFTKFHILNEDDDLVKKNIQFADKILGDARNGIVAIDDKKRQVLALQVQEEVLKVYEQKAYLFDTYAVEHGLSAHMNFSYDFEKDSAQASLPALFLTRVMNHSVRNYKRDGFVELPDVRGIMSRETFQTRLLEEKFNAVIQSNRNR
ncbi:MAG: hypothetical protein WCL30_02610, partial [Pseudomonadota bacterium]